MNVLGPFYLSKWTGKKGARKPGNADENVKQKRLFCDFWQRDSECDVFPFFYLPARSTDEYNSPVSSKGVPRGRMPW
jgi:hypothetical protein